MGRPSFRRVVMYGIGAIGLAYLLQLISIASFGNGSSKAEQSVSVDPDARRLQQPQWLLDQNKHAITPLSDDQLRTLAGMSDKERFLGLLQPILIPRVPGTPGNTKVQQHITSVMEKLGYTIELDRFDDQPPAPHARRTFTNIIATQDPRAPRRLVLACHFDSKFDNRGEFIGATDSAVPCAMLLDLATSLRNSLSNKSMKTDITLQLLFLDGEEAFGEWSNTDSIYGARHLAESLGRRRNKFAPNVASMTELSSMDLFVLLDLIGTTDTNFKNFFEDNTGRYYRWLADAEDKLTSLRLVKQWGRQGVYFERGRFPFGMVDDDHRPFMNKGVKILHLISYPFPSVWHKYEDNLSNIHYDTVDDINKMLRVFVCQYLACRF